MERDLDIIIFGATGYTGQWSIKESVKLFPDLRWGIAGRSKDKLVAVLKQKGDEIGRDLSHIPIIIADTNDEDSIRQMTEQGIVIVSFCGPYRLYGEVVIRACIETGTHFIDVTAEEQFVNEMELKYNEKAYDGGVYVINACGVISVFGDMGVIFLENNFDGQVNSVESFMGLDIKQWPKNQLLHYGSWESATLEFASIREFIKRKSQWKTYIFNNLLPKPKTYYLIHGTKKINNNYAVRFWTLDEPIVRGTQIKLHELEQKRPVFYNTYVIMPWVYLIATFIMGLIFVILNSFKFGRRILLKFPEFFSCGLVGHNVMTEEELKNIKAYVIFHGVGWSKSDDMADEPKKKIITKITAPEAACITSAICALVAAKTIVNEAHKIPLKGGVITPGTAFVRTNYIEELSKSDIKFEVISCDESVEKQR